MRDNALYDLRTTMKDIGRKAIASILALGGAGSIAWYVLHGIQVVQDYLASSQMIIIAGFALLFAVFFLLFGMVITSLKRPKTIAGIIGLVIVLASAYTLRNDATQGIYVGDIVMIIGVLIIYLTLTGAIVTKKTQQKILDAKQIIIEV